MFELTVTSSGEYYKRQYAAYTTAKPEVDSDIQNSQNA